MLADERATSSECCAVRKHKTKAEATGRAFPMNGWEKLHRSEAHAVLKLAPIAAQLYLALLCRIRSDDRTCSLPVETLVADTGLSESTVRRARLMLVEAGILHVDEQSKGGRQVNNVYRLGATSPDDKPCHGRQGISAKTLSPVTQNPVTSDAQTLSPVTGHYKNRQESLEEAGAVPAPSTSAPSANSEPEAAQPSPGSRPRMRPPTRDEVRASCQQRGYGMDPDSFVDHFASNGWKVGGKAPMRDWQAAVNQWERRERKGRPKPREEVSVSYEEQVRRFRATP